VRSVRLAAMAAAAGILLLAVVWFGARAVSVGRIFSSRTTITHDVAVERMRAVARLVTSETGVRDVVTYRRTWLGSTKQALVVVSAKVVAGIDLEPGADVAIDQAARRITVTLPHARVLGVEITDLKTYDERSGLWNPFRPSDRDSIFSVARRQLVGSAQDIGVVPHAEESARRLLEGLFGSDGYTTTVVFRP
jgi:hypothetical protein